MIRVTAVDMVSGFGVSAVPDTCAHFPMACNQIPEKQPMGGEVEVVGGASLCPSLPDR